MPFFLLAFLLFSFFILYTSSQDRQPYQHQSGKQQVLFKGRRIWTM